MWFGTPKVYADARSMSIEDLDNKRRARKTARRQFKMEKEEKDKAGKVDPANPYHPTPDPLNPPFGLEQPTARIKYPNRDSAELSTTSGKTSTASRGLTPKGTARSVGSVGAGRPPLGELVPSNAMALPPVVPSGPAHVTPGRPPLPPLSMRIASNTQLVGAGDKSARTSMSARNKRMDNVLSQPWEALNKASAPQPWEALNKASARSIGSASAFSPHPSRPASVRSYTNSVASSYCSCSECASCSCVSGSHMSHRSHHSHRPVGLNNRKASGSVLSLSSSRTRSSYMSAGSSASRTVSSETLSRLQSLQHTLEEERKARQQTQEALKRTGDEVNELKSMVQQLMVGGKSN